MLLTWLEPLSCFPQSAIDYAFRDYLRNGSGEWFDIHAITKRCQTFCDAEEAKRPSFVPCGKCREGWVQTEQFSERLGHNAPCMTSCECRKAFIAAQKAGE